MECFPEDFVLLFTSHVLFFLLTLFYVELRLFFIFVEIVSLGSFVQHRYWARRGGRSSTSTCKVWNWSKLLSLESFVYDLVFNFFVIYNCSILLKFFFIFHSFWKGCSWDSSRSALEPCLLFWKCTPHSGRRRCTSSCEPLLFIWIKDGSLYVSFSPCLHVWWEVT